MGGFTTCGKTKMRRLQKLRFVGNNLNMTDRLQRDAGSAKTCILTKRRSKADILYVSFWNIYGAMLKAVFLRHAST